ncbi:MAG TPA: hypothetical protein VM818_17050 [Vicinamibacterales bacterium]|nr:hypothetical protein [Vicinamibacterales bacterium]
MAFDAEHSHARDSTCEEESGVADVRPDIDDKRLANGKCARYHRNVAAIIGQGLEDARKIM